MKSKFWPPVVRLCRIMSLLSRSWKTLAVGFCMKMLQLYKKRHISRVPSIKIGIRIPIRIRISCTGFGSLFYVLFLFPILKNESGSGFYSMLRVWLVYTVTCPDCMYCFGSGFYVLWRVRILCNESISYPYPNFINTRNWKLKNKP